MARPKTGSNWQNEGNHFPVKNGKPEVNRKWVEPNRKKYANVFVEGGGRNGGNKSTVSGMIPSQVLRITAGVEYLPLIISAGYSVINTRHAAKRGRGNKWTTTGLWHTHSKTKYRKYIIYLFIFITQQRIKERDDKKNTQTPPPSPPHATPSIKPPPHNKHGHE